MDMRQRLGELVGSDETWERPRPTRADIRADVVLTAVLWAINVASLELTRSFMGFPALGDSHPWWFQHLLLAAVVPLVWRRVAPTLVLAYATVAYPAVSLTSPATGVQIGWLVWYLLAVYTALAWARDRRMVVVTVGASMVVMFGWISWDLAVDTSGRRGSPAFGTSPGNPGLLAPASAYALYTTLVNTVFFASAIWAGRLAWFQARDRARVAAQADTIAYQSAELQRRAVLDERLRIARELHDVVAHHVSVIGLQAGAARRVLAADPSAARAGLATIEDSSREAVTQMRALLGTLRRDGETDPPGDRSPEPSLASLPALVAGIRRPGLRVTYEVSETGDDKTDAAPRTVQLALCRTVQEALTNVLRHSTATQVHVVIRTGVDSRAAGYIEAEVVDNGHPRAGTSGSGLGHLGIRERAAALGGRAEIGPRPLGGYRVRVRLPLDPVREDAHV